jgi:hypothetical protein
MKRSFLVGISVGVLCLVSTSSSTTQTNVELLGYFVRGPGLGVGAPFPFPGQ